MNTTRWGVALAFALMCAGVRSQPPADPKHDPARAIANLDIHPELEATLFASEPAMTNPTNLDIDHRGRVWICDVVNYRGNNNKRPEGDRILIFEDTDGDGKFDKVKTFYQGRDVDSAMGICILGNQVIVSTSPNIIVFTFDEQDRVTKKEVLFTKTGQAQHDHSAHSFLPGPDGKMYWNFGNTGQAVHDKQGKIVVDQAGNDVRDQGKPYWGGMVFRSNRDGSKFEVLGHNFRNNYEVTLDSFGTLWQSDNDDDGNRGVRINYVMEFGNFGYRDEFSGAGWNSPRTNLEPEIPLRHWHLNDPGVVPNLLQTGGGSPAGICLYEGTLLPKVFQGQIIHCEPGLSVVRSYPVQKDGAGYKAGIVNILDGNKKNNWFRPADVCTAPDGSIFVTDWYDPGVGGHGQRDLERGRIFRVAPPGSKYQTPHFDFATTSGAIEALKNPALSVRYLAWEALNKFGAAAEPGLAKLFRDAGADPRHRARALWLLGALPSKGDTYCEEALKDANPDIRIVGIRVIRQHWSMIEVAVDKVSRDPDPAVRREAAIALRHLKSRGTASLWANLAAQHDGKDRWYLEALGIGADKQWDGFLSAYLDLKQGGAAERDIIWRSRSTRTPSLLAKIILDPAVPLAELPRYFRAFDFQSGPEKDDALLQLITAERGKNSARDGLILSEAGRRLKALDLAKNPKLADALETVLKSTSDKTTFVELVSSFQIAKHYPALLEIARHNPDQQLVANATKALLDRKQMTLLQQGASAKDPKDSVALIQALGTAADERANSILLPIVEDSKRDAESRRQAVRALSRTKTGAQSILKLAQDKKLDDELKPAASLALHTATWKDVRSVADKLFPQPASKDDRPLPSIASLAKMAGDSGKGQVIFKTTGTCANCHIVNGEGKDVGPNLSEIGKKLSREALYESILYPSAAISHNYESYVIETKSGNVETGLLVSDTPEAVTLKGADSIQRTLKRAEIDAMRRSPISLMPADLHKNLSIQDLADLVEYMLILREAQVIRKQ